MVMQTIKRILTDVLGISLIIIAPLFGWLPGPGGLPLFLAGLGLLSINHDWAKRLLDYVKEHGLKRLERLLRENKLVQNLTDTVGLALAGIGLWYLLAKDGPVSLFGVIYLLTSALLLLLSRERYKKLLRKP